MARQLGFYQLLSRLFGLSYERKAGRLTPLPNGITFFRKGACALKAVF